VGKWENLLLVFHFSIRLRRRICGNVGISPSFDEISKGLVGRVGSLPLAFHAFHSPGISTDLFVWLRLCDWLLRTGVFFLLAVL
jgi:hypothetical protein